VLNKYPSEIMCFHFKYRTHYSKQGKSISSVVRGKPK